MHLPDFTFSGEFANGNWCNGERTGGSHTLAGQDSQRVKWAVWPSGWAVGNSAVPS